MTDLSFERGEHVAHFAFYFQHVLLLFACHVQVAHGLHCVKNLVWGLIVHVLTRSQRLRHMHQWDLLRPLQATISIIAGASKRDCRTSLLSYVARFAALEGARVPSLQAFCLIRMVCICQILICVLCRPDSLLNGKHVKLHDLIIDHGAFESSRWYLGASRIGKEVLRA
jgi:hypothetical protein